jgi:hypothetical protein
MYFIIYHIIYHFICNIFTLTNISEIRIELRAETHIGLKIKHLSFLAKCNEHLYETATFLRFFYIVVLKIPSVVLQYMSTDRDGAFLTCSLRMN